MPLGGIASVKQGGAGISTVAGAAFSQLGNATAAITTAAVDTLATDIVQTESLSMLLVCGGTLTAAHNITFTLSVEHADANASNTGPGSFATAPTAAQPITAGSVFTAAGGTYLTLQRYDLRVGSLKRYVRFVVTPAVASGANTDTLNGAIAVVEHAAANLVTRSVQWLANYTAA